MRTVLPILSMLLTVLTPGCGGTQPPAEDPAPAGADQEGKAEGSGSEESAEGPAGEDGSPEKASASNGSTDDGTRNTEKIRGIIKENRQKFRDCYEAALKELPGLEGDLTLKFVLDPDGKVKSAEVNLERSTLKSEKVGQCAVEAIKKLQFPPSGEGMDTAVNYPFNFNP